MILERWAALDVDAPPTVDWPRPLSGDRAVLLLGAFDPPTNAHLAIVRAAAAVSSLPGALGLTKVLLAKDRPKLLSDEQRITVLDAIGRRTGLGLALSNRGTYLDVHRAIVAQGIEPSFVIGSDKLAQLADPRFYPDGSRGVDATFDEVSFIVVPRGRDPLERPGVTVLDPSDVFDSAKIAALTATEVRARIADGTDVGHLVPPEVVRAIGGYTSAR